MDLQTRYFLSSEPACYSYEHGAVYRKFSKFYTSVEWYEHGRVYRVFTVILKLGIGTSSCRPIILNVVHGCGTGGNMELHTEYIQNPNRPLYW